MWAYVGVGLFAAAIVTAGLGWRLADEARRPIGEGELFLDAIETALGHIEASRAPVDEAIRLFAIASKSKR